MTYTEYADATASARQNRTKLPIEAFARYVADEVNVNPDNINGMCHLSFANNGHGGAR